MVAKTQNEATEPAQDGSLPNLRFDSKWKATFQFDKVKTVSMAGIDGEPFYYPLLTVTVVDPGTAPKVQGGDQVLIHAYPETLIAELKRVKPQAGAVLTIDYRGETKSKSNRTVKVFEIDSPDTAETDWDNPGF